MRRALGFVGFGSGVVPRSSRCAGYSRIATASGPDRARSADADPRFDPSTYAVPMPLFTTPGFIGWRRLECWHSLGPAVLDGGGTGDPVASEPRRFLLEIEVSDAGWADGDSPEIVVGIDIRDASAADLVSITDPNALVPLDRGRARLAHAVVVDPRTRRARFGVSTFSACGDATVAVSILQGPVVRTVLERVTVR